MVKIKFIALLIVLIPFLSIATPNPASNKELIAQFPANAPKYNIYRIIKAEEKAYTTNWAFVIDASNSTSKVVGRLLAGFNVAVSHPSDELNFCAFAFNQRWHYKFRSWRSADLYGVEFSRTARWIRRNIGVNSYAMSAIQGALLQPKKNLTIVIISDGGFSEDFADILGTIKKSQQWRVDNGYGLAVIATVGIENHLSRLSTPPYPKDPDSICQDRMAQIGAEGSGGYYLVQRIE
jgi:hypothetical protein